jgi:hypothetical protein
MPLLCSLGGTVMKRLFALGVLAALAAAPLAAQSQSTATSTSMMGVGAHGYDWLIGTWSCINSMPSPMGGPKNQTLTASRSEEGAALFLRGTGKNFDLATYIAYAPKTKTWWGPVAFADGSYGSESTTDTGKKTVWTGTYVSADSGKTLHTRDTYTMLSPTKYTDLGEYQSAGSWKPTYKTTCTKS